MAAALGSVPGEAETRERVERVRAWAGPGTTGYEALRRLLVVGDFQAWAGDLGTGRVEGFLTGSSTGGFLLCVSRRAAEAAQAGLGGPSDFLCAHEVAHSLFYDCSTVPVARMRVADREEEAFCDRFAGLLLVGEDGGGVVTPLQLRERAQACGASVGAVAYWARVSRPGVLVVAVRGVAPRLEVVWANGEMAPAMLTWLQAVVRGRAGAAEAEGRRLTWAPVKVSCRGARLLVISASPGTRPGG
jgi:hypothetical protein